MWRNKLRSFVVITAVTVGIFGAIYSYALMNGLINQKIVSTINFETSHIQIHHPKFKQNKEPYFLIENAQKIVEGISKIPEVDEVTRRMIFLSLANTSNSSTAVLVCGINPEIEKKITNIYSSIQDSSGGYFNSEKDNQLLISVSLSDKLQLSNFEISENTLKELYEKDVPEKIISKISVLQDIKFRSKKDFKDTLKYIIGKKLAKEFEYPIITYSRGYKLKSNIILKMQDFNGNFVEKAFKIGGVYSTGNDLFDDVNVFVRNEEILDLLNYNSEDSHQITILLKDEKNVDNVVSQLKIKYPELQIQSWGELKPVIILIKKWITISYFFLIGIILLALGFGIVNTMLMTVLERVKEFGMLIAIGMNKKKVFKMIMLESIFLSATGGITGLIISAIIVEIYGKQGHDFTRWIGQGYQTIGFDAIIYPNLDILHYCGVVILVVLTGIIAAVYPAKKALKLSPVEALKTDA